MMARRMAACTCLMRVTYPVISKSYAAHTNDDIQNIMYTAAAALL